MCLYLIRNCFSLVNHYVNQYVTISLGFQMAYLPKVRSGNFVEIKCTDAFQPSNPTIRILSYKNDTANTELSMTKDDYIKFSYEFLY